MKNIIKNRETFRETILGAAKAFALFCALFCANSAIFAQTCMEKKAKISVKNVEVVVDNIQEKGISLQIFNIAKSSLNGQKFLESPSAGGEGYSISISLSERSFYKNIESAHALYTHYQLFSDSGECVLENVFCSESKSSIISTLAQKKQIEKIAKDLKKYFAGGSKKDA